MRRFTPLLVLGLAASSFAWHDTGHMVVAEIASRHLTPQARARIEKLLAIGATPKTADMATAACWADDFKNGQSAPWHYINYHFDRSYRPTENIPEAENVVWAIRRFSETLKDPKADDGAKAAALRYLLHFVGDIHQPLHNVARDTEATPGGDRGGNDFKLVAPEGMKPAPRNLHFLWDMGAGLFTSVERPLNTAGRATIIELATRAMRAHPVSQFQQQLALADPEDWSREGLALAKAKVYRLEEEKAPPRAYLEMVQKESLRLVALAGYRLGKMLNRVLE